MFNDYVYIELKCIL